MPQRYILLADDFGNRRILALPLASRQLPVVSAQCASEDRFTAVRCHTRPLSKNKAIQASRCGGIFSVQSFSHIPQPRSHLCPKIKSATPSPIRK
jgi:hypothetical protein